MKIFVYGLSSEELIYFKQCEKKYQIEIAYCNEKATLANAHLCKGYQAISILSTPTDADLIQAFYDQGVRFISTRTIGYEHIDLNKCKELNIHVGNATYGSESVADYTIMCMLMVLRKMKLIMRSYEIQDYGFDQILGQNITNKTVGIIGTGNIGEMVIKHLQGFQCDILAYSPHPKASLQDLCKYVSLDELYQQSDIISLHLRLNDDTYHFLNEASFDKMKKGVIIINTARGGLIDNQALIKALDEHKVSGAALDVCEGEAGIYYNNHKGDILLAHELKILNGYLNVLMLPHVGFLTDDARKDMVYHSVESCYKYLNKLENPWQII